MSALVPANAAALEVLDPSQREAAVTAYLEHAREQLALAVSLTGPEAVAAIKAQIATAAEATKQLGLSREIQQDAQEMVRRAEYALGKAIRAGQERGEVARSGERRDLVVKHNEVPRPTTTEVAGVRNRSDLSAIYDLSDDVTEAEFDAALSDARAEGNVSRANVVRKIRNVKTEGLTPVERLRRLRELAPKGYTSSQIANEIGTGEEWVRKLARDNGIEITADRTMGRARRNINADRVMSETVNVLDGLVTSIGLINLSELNPAQMSDWANSLTDSIRALNRFVKQIKELAQ